MYFGAAVGLFVALIASVAMAEEIGCECGVNLDIFDYPLADLRDELYTEEFPWQMLAIKPIKGLTSCEVTIGLVYEDNPALENLPDGELSHLEYIFDGTRWVDFDDFEKYWRSQGCIVLSS